MNVFPLYAEKVPEYFRMLIFVTQDEELTLEE